MSGDPYTQAHELQALVEQAADRLAAVLARREALARPADRDEIRGALDHATGALDAFEALLDWIEESDLPPGLRATLDRPGIPELRR